MTVNQDFKCVWCLNNCSLLWLIILRVSKGVRELVNLRAVDYQVGSQLWLIFVGSEHWVRAQSFVKQGPVFTVCS